MTNRLDRAAVREALEAQPSALCGVLVMVSVGGEQALFIRLGADGGIHRLGVGSLDTGERERFIGTTTPETFERVRAKVTPELLKWCGQGGSDPYPRGEVCELVVALKQPDGEESMMCWRYGLDSQWPPPEVCEFVAAAVEATDPWYEEQKDAVRRRSQQDSYAWWQFFALPHA